jgi:hypothetical protein
LALGVGGWSCFADLLLPLEVGKERVSRFLIGSRG